MKAWTCIKNCGACCRFDLRSRENILNILSDEDIRLIDEMTDKDGWCKNLDKKNMTCNIYNERPHFCRVDKFSKNFNEYIKKGDKFLINCCKQHISSVYGSKSRQMRNFKLAIND